MAACHLIADGKLTLLGDIAADDLCLAGASSSLFSRVNSSTLTTMPYSPWGDLEGGISDLFRLLAEYGAEQSLLCGQSVSPLGVYLFDGRCRRVNFGSDADMPRSSGLLRRSSEETFRDIPCDLLELRTLYLSLRSRVSQYESSVDIVANHLFVDENRVLVVVAFPGHEADKGVLAEGYLAVIRCGTVGYDVALSTRWLRGDYRALVDACALVGSA